jgi:hypothetical protein
MMILGGKNESDESLMRWLFPFASVSKSVIGLLSRPSECSLIHPPLSTVGIAPVSGVSLQ